MLANCLVLQCIGFLCKSLSFLQELNSIFQFSVISKLVEGVFY